MHNERGQALIELALAIFLLLMVLYGITEWGRYIFERNTINSAARAGVRQAVVTDGLTAENDTGTITTYVKETVLGLSTVDELASVTVTVEIIDLGGVGLNGDQVKVTVSQEFEILTGTIIPFFDGTRDIVADASMRYEL